MIIIVDGYNFLKKILTKDRLSETERSAFINKLGRYIKKREHKLVVVFDAGPEDGVYQERQKGVDVVYSGQHKSADDVIALLVKQWQGKELVVITQDRELERRVKSQTLVSVLEPDLFAAKLEHALAPAAHEIPTYDSGLKKLSIDKNDELDRLMYEAVQGAIPTKEEAGGSGRTKEAEQRSKKDKEWQRIIGKL